MHDGRPGPARALRPPARHRARPRAGDRPAVPADAALRHLGRPDGRPGGQAAPALRHPVRRRPPGPCPRRPGGDRCGHLWQVYLLAALFGVVNMFDNPARQTFVSEMVGHDLLPNAISLNSVRHELGPGDRAGHRRGPDRHRGLRRLLPRQRGVLRRGADRPLAHAPERAAPAPGGRPGQGPGPRGPPLRLVDARAPGPLARHGGGRDLRLQLHRPPCPLLAKITFHGGAGTYSALTAAMGVGRRRRRPDRGSPQPADAALLSVIGLAFGVMIAGRRRGPDRGRGPRSAGPRWGSAASPSSPPPTPPSSSGPTRPCGVG